MSLVKNAPSPSSSPNVIHAHISTPPSSGGASSSGSVSGSSSGVTPISGARHLPAPISGGSGGGIVGGHIGTSSSSISSPPRSSVPTGRRPPTSSSMSSSSSSMSSSLSSSTPPIPKSPLIGTTSGNPISGGPHTPSSSSSGYRHISLVPPSSTPSPRSKVGVLSSQNPWAPPLLPLDIKSLNGKWDGDASGKKGAQTLTINLSFSPMEGSLVIEHPHNPSAVCFATTRIRGHGHCIENDDALKKSLIITATGLLDPNTGVIELCIASTHGYYAESLTFRGVLDYVSRSLQGEASGSRAASLKLTFTGEVEPKKLTVSPKSLTKQVHPPGTGSSEQRKHRSAASAPIFVPSSQSQSLTTLAPSTSSSLSSIGSSGDIKAGGASGSGEWSLNERMNGDGRLWEGKLSRHSSDITIGFYDTSLIFKVNNDIGSIEGSGTAIWPTGYRAPFTLEGSFDHRGRITMLWAECSIKLMMEPPQKEQFIITIDVNHCRIEGHNPNTQLKLYPAVSKSAGEGSSGGNDTTAVGTMMGDTGDNTTGSGGAGSGSGTSGGSGSGEMMYAPQMTPHGITYVLMPVPMALQAHAAAAQMQVALYGSQATMGGSSGYNYYPLPPLVNPPAPIPRGENTGDGEDTTEGETTSKANPSDTPSSGSGGPNSGLSIIPMHMALPPIDPSYIPPLGHPMIPSLDPHIIEEVNRQRKHNQHRPQKQPQSEAEVIASFQQFEVGDRVYMYTMPANIVQSILLRGPVTMGLKDSPYPYCSPKQLHYNPGVLPRSEGGKKRKHYQHHNNQQQDNQQYQRQYQHQQHQQQHVDGQGDAPSGMTSPKTPKTSQHHKAYDRRGHSNASGHPKPHSGGSHISSVSGGGDIPHGRVLSPPSTPMSIQPNVRYTLHPIVPPHHRRKSSHPPNQQQQARHHSGHPSGQHGKVVSSSSSSMSTSRQQGHSSPILGGPRPH